MSDSGEKKKKPTAKKKRESRKQGQVAKVPTIPKLLSLIAVLELALAFRDSWWSLMEGGVEHAMRHLVLATGNLGNYALFSLVSAPLLSYAIVACLIALGIASLFAMVGNMMQTGMVVSPEAIPKAQFLDPISNAKNMFMPEQLLQVPMNFLKVIVIGIAITLALLHSIDDILHLPDHSLQHMFNVSLDILAYAYRSTLACIFLCVVVDWAIRRHFHSKEIMMTQEEYDREMKEEFGNKHVRQQRKRITNEIMNGDTKKKVKKADAVVVNPTHFAVALQYAPSNCPLPVVLARGTGQTADLIRQTALENGIPVVRSIWLARTLFAVGRENHVIPRQTYHAVAMVYRAILQLAAEGRANKGIIEIDTGSMNAAIKADFTAEADEPDTRDASGTRDE